MSRKPGNIARFLTNLKNSFFVAKQDNAYIGSDQFGNKYYEKIGGKSNIINCHSFGDIQSRGRLPYQANEIDIQLDYIATVKQPPNKMVC